MNNIKMSIESIETDLTESDKPIAYVNLPVFLMSFIAVIFLYLWQMCLSIKR